VELTARLAALSCRILSGCAGCDGEAPRVFTKNEIFGTPFGGGVWGSHPWGGTWDFELSY